MGESLIVRRAGGGQKLTVPTLNGSLPSNVTIIAAANGNATFSIAIAEAGNPPEYTYQWYKNDVLISGATGTTVTITGLTSAQTATVYCLVSSKAGSVKSRVATLTVQNYTPVYTYTGSHELINDGNYNWRIKFKTSGTLNFSSLGNATSIDAFCVGGGAGGWGSVNNWGPSGSGGYTTTRKGFTVTTGTNYTIVIGAGGPENSQNVNGGTTSGFGISANGGQKQKGGSGSCAYGDIDVMYGSPGTDGGDGYDGFGNVYGVGQHTTTREFAEAGATLYSSGGPARTWVPGGANTGNGGSSSGGSFPAAGGGSGIVVIRNHR